MRKKQWMIGLFTLLLLLVAGFWSTQELPVEKEEVLPFSVSVYADGDWEEIDSWKNSAGDYTIFLPSYADLSQVRLHIAKESLLFWNGQQLEDGMACDAFQLDTPYSLSFQHSGGNRELTVTFLQSGNVPTMYIDVQSGSMDYIHAVKGNAESGRVSLYSASGELEHAGRMDSLSGRGNATWALSKKAYSLTLATEADLLGMGQAQKWILLANAYDPSHLKNKIVYDFAAGVGMEYTPQCQWVDLYLNGEYAGLYLLCERNEVHPQRVDISGSGSFLVSSDAQWRLAAQGLSYITTDAGFTLRIQDSTISNAEIARVCQSVENAILAEDGIDPVTGKHWTDLIDLDSWVRKYLIEEIFGNPDAGTASQFFYRDGDGKLYAGPVWDYDASMVRYAPNVFFAYRPHAWEGVETPWYYTLYQKDLFYDRLTELYQTEFRPLLSALFEEGLDQYAAQIQQAASLNQIRWSCTDAAEYTENVRSYMTQRLEFLDDVWIHQSDYCIVLVNTGEGYASASYAVRPGETLTNLPTYDDIPNALGWYDASTDTPFDTTQPIWEDMEITLKCVEEEGSGLGTLIQIAPVVALATLLALLVLADIFKTKRSGRQKHERRKISP